MKVAVWNIRGIGAEAKKVTVKKLINAEKIDMMGLVETKHNTFSPWLISKLWGHHNIGWAHIPAENSSGGILVSWHHDSFKEIRTLVSNRWICVFGEFVQEGFVCAICVLYAPNNQHERLELWNILRALRQHLSIPLILMGDFNEVVNLEERKNATHVTTSMKELRDFIQDLQMHDLDINQQYTWMRENAASRLDRVLVSHECMEKFQLLPYKL